MTLLSAVGWFVRVIAVIFIILEVVGELPYITLLLCGEGFRNKGETRGGERERRRQESDAYRERKSFGATVKQRLPPVGVKTPLKEDAQHGNIFNARPRGASPASAGGCKCYCFSVSFTARAALINFFANVCGRQSKRKPQRRDTSACTVVFFRASVLTKLHYLHAQKTRGSVGMQQESCSLVSRVYLGLHPLRRLDLWMLNAPLC